MIFLCDTNIVSEVMKRSPNPIVKIWISRQDMLCISVITVEEIYCGLAHKDARRQYEWFQKFVQLRCDVFPITISIAKQCGNLRGKLLQRGIVRTQADLMIAATAYEHNLILATRNTQDFEDCDIQLFNPFNLPTASITDNEENQKA